VNKSWASIIPLDYTEDPSHPRVEYSITYFSTDWESLVDLLTAPHEFLRKVGERWPQKHASSGRVDQDVHWKLLSPTTIEIAPATQSLTSVARMAEVHGVNVEKARNNSIQALLDSGFDAQKHIGSPAVSPGQTPDETKQLVASALHDQFAAGLLHETLIADLCGEISGGAYLAEFAPNTHLLQVYYWPPHACHADAANSALDPYGQPVGHRFTKKFTKATLGMDGRGGTLHFDIGKGARARAQFVVDHLENCGRTCQKLNGEFEGAFIGETTLFAEGEVISIIELEFLEHRRKPFMPPLASSRHRAAAGSTPQHANLAAVNSPGTDHQVVVVPPTVVIEMASDGDDPYVCAMQPAVANANSVVAVHPLTLKNYVDPTPTP
jgi:hypothetical protein